MRHIEIESTYVSPKVILNPETGSCLFSGNSILFDVDQFYDPLINWIEAYVSQAHRPKIEVTLNIENYNALSIERLAIILQRLERYKQNGGQVQVNWNYQAFDEDTLEVGKNFSQLLNLPFHYSVLGGGNPAF